MLGARPAAGDRRRPGWDHGGSLDSVRPVGFHVGVSSDAPRALLDRERLLRDLTPAEIRARSAAEASGRPFLVYACEDGSRRFHVLDQATPALTVGRRSASDIALTWDRRVSKDHALLESAGGQWLIQDLASKNGTWLNGERLGRERRALAGGDLVRVGATQIVFSLTSVTDADMTLAEEARPDPRRLTNAQLRVLRALCAPSLAQGSFAGAPSNEEIARTLSLTADAVKKHLGDIYSAMGLADRPQNRKRNELVIIALESGIFEVSAP